MLELQGTTYVHTAYVSTDWTRSARLHVYIEHDGSPWIGETQPADDPTPRRPLAVELMARDDGPRLLLGRPCYHGRANDDACNALAWTHERYSPGVVRSMAAALRGFAAQRGVEEIVLIGYSGGGTLAWLMAAEVPEARSVITIAANLDIDAWTALHGYSALTGSLNPARVPPLPSTIQQVHLAGADDRNVPPAVVRSFARSQRVPITEIGGFDHVCCWVEHWPSLLQQIRQSSADAVRSPPH